MISKRRCLLGTTVGVLLAVVLYATVLSKMALPPNDGVPPGSAPKGMMVHDEEEKKKQKKKAPRAPQHQQGLKNGMREHEPGADTLGGK